VTRICCLFAPLFVCLSACLLDCFAHPARFSAIAEEIYGGKLI